MLSVALASEHDLEDVAGLLHQVELHYHGRQAAPREVLAARVRTDLLAAPSGVRVALAREGGRAAGIASFAILYPAPGMSGELFLKELFVAPGARGRGIGSELLRFLAGIAIDEGCSRMDWTTERDNLRAMELYERLGARRMEEKLHFRLAGGALRRLAGRL